MRRTIFEGYGCEIIQDGALFFIRYDSGESAGSRICERQISFCEAERAMQSELDAYEVSLAAERRE
jgi:hypothetical protein